MEWEKALSFTTCEYGREGFSQYVRTIPKDINYLEQTLKHLEIEYAIIPDSFRRINESNSKVCKNIEQLMISFDKIVNDAINTASISLNPVTDWRDFKHNTYLIRDVLATIFSDIGGLLDRNSIQEIRVIEIGNSTTHQLQVHSSGNCAIGDIPKLEQLRAVMNQLIQNNHELRRIVGEYRSLVAQLDVGRAELVGEMRDLANRWQSGRPAEKLPLNYPLCEDCPPSPD